MSGHGGWVWLSSTRDHKPVPQDSVGLRAVAVKLQARKKKAIEMDNQKAADLKEGEAKVKGASQKQDEKVPEDEQDVKTEVKETVDIGELSKVEKETEGKITQKQAGEN